MADGTTRRCFSFDDPDGLPEPFVRDLGTLSSQTKVGHLAAALDLLMREVGFVVGSVPSFATGLSQEYSLETAKSCCAHLQVVTVLSKAVVLGTFNMTDLEPAAFSTDLAITRYIDDLSLPVAKRFTHRKELSLLFKTKVAVPLLIHARQALDLPPGPESLLSLPDDIALNLMYFLGLCDNYLDVLHLGMCCKRLSVLADDSYLWKAMLKKKYPASYKGAKEGEGKDWKKLYKRKHVNVEIFFGGADMNELRSKNDTCFMRDVPEGYISTALFCLPLALRDGLYNPLC